MLVEGCRIWSASLVEVLMGVGKGERSKTKHRYLRYLPTYDEARDYMQKE